jgi:uncharacterized membrane protein YeaQ/YmgE (transglycosylase-associated protein family)
MIWEEKVSRAGAEQRWTQAPGYLLSKKWGDEFCLWARLTLCCRRHDSARLYFCGGKRMTLVDLLVLLLIAGVCGALGQAIGGFSRGGCLVSIALGFIGALIGTWLARNLGLPELLPVNIGGQSFPIIWSIIGAALFVAVIGLISRRR